jgi:PleD family two-component response regulator
VVTTTGGLRNAGELIHLADELMYEVKRSGKGRTTFRVGLFPAPSEPAPSPE